MAIVCNSFNKNRFFDKMYKNEICKECFEKREKEIFRK